MANYTKTTNFTAKDSLPSGNAAKKILGSLFDTEFNNISTAIATKAGTADTTFTGSTTLAQLTLASGASVTAILDEDDMASNSATAVTTQQSTKAYVLSVVTDIGALLVTGTPATNDFAKFTSAAEIVGRSYAETRADLSLEVGTDVQAYDADTAKLDVVQTFTTTQTWTKGADVASDTELPLVTDGNYFDVTGTTTATSFANLAVGTMFKLHFDGAMILTNNTDIVCLSGANITTAAGDEAEFVFFEAGKVRMTNYSKASGEGLISSPPPKVAQIVNTQTGALATGTTTMPLDDTIPQNGEGDQYMSLTITPTSSTNKLLIEVVLMGSSSSGRSLAAALFQDSTANALAAIVNSSASSTTNPSCLSFSHTMTAGTTSATTFKVRSGPSSSATFYFNGAGNGSTRIYGGVAASSITITEYST